MNIVKVTNLMNNNNADYKGLDLSLIQAGSQIYQMDTNMVYILYNGEVPSHPDLIVIDQATYDQVKQAEENKPKPPTITEQLNSLQDQLKTADQKYKELDLTTASLTDVQNAKIAQIRYFYEQTLTGGFKVTIGTTAYTFGWSSKDETHLNSAQTAITKAFATFPIYYGDVNGNPVTLSSQADLDSIEQEATKFAFAQHQQILNIVGQVQSATTNSAVDAIQWTAATY